MTVPEARIAPHVARNAQPIGDVLAQVLPDAGLVLELASGTGEHAVRFAQRFPRLIWQPSDVDPSALGSIEAWRSKYGLANLRSPLEIDVSSGSWPIRTADAAVAINLTHISPWETTSGLFDGCSRCLVRGAPLLIYGPFRRGSRRLEPSNQAFDLSLRSRDPRFGLREVDAVAMEARRAGFTQQKMVEMPANNLTIVFRAGFPGQ